MHQKEIVTMFESRRELLCMYETLEGKTQSRIRMAFRSTANSSRPSHSRVSKSSGTTLSSNSRTLVPTLEFQPSMDVQVPWIVPYERNHYFTGRDTQMSSVRLKFSEAKQDHYRIAIHGLGGDGKTQFALEYLYRYRNDY